MALFKWLNLRLEGLYIRLQFPRCKAKVRLIRRAVRQKKSINDNKLKLLVICFCCGEGTRILGRNGDGRKSAQAEFK